MHSNKELEAKKDSRQGELEEFGVILDEVSDGVLENILKIYDEVNGGRALKLTDAAGFRKQLELGFPGLRYGSRYSMDTKLYARKVLGENGKRVLKFSCSTYGYMEKPTKLDREILKSQDVFKTEINKYLQGAGVGIPVMRNRF